MRLPAALTGRWALPSAPASLHQHLYEEPHLCFGWRSDGHCLSKSTCVIGFAVPHPELNSAALFHVIRVGLPPVSTGTYIASLSVWLEEQRKSDSASRGRGSLISTLDNWLGGDLKQEAQVLNHPFLCQSRLSEAQ